MYRLESSFFLIENNYPSEVRKTIFLHIPDQRKIWLRVAQSQSYPFAFYLLLCWGLVLAWEVAEFQCWSWGCSGRVRPRPQGEWGHCPCRHWCRSPRAIRRFQRTCLDPAKHGVVDEHGEHEIRLSKFLRRSDLLC